MNGIQRLAPVVYDSFICLCDLKMWSVRGCCGGLKPASRPNEPCWKKCGRKELVPGPPWSSEPLRGIPIQSLVPSLLLPSTILPHSVSGEPHSDGTPSD